MHNEFTALIEQEGEWFISYCPEIPGANGQGRTKEDSVTNLAQAVELILLDQRLSSDPTPLDTPESS